MLLLLSRLICWLPLPLAMGLGQCLGLFWYYLLPIRCRVARQNVARVFGDSLPARRQRQIVRASCINICMYAIEGLRMPSMSRALSTALVARTGMAHMDAALANGRGVIAVTAHVGNFDLAGTSQTVRGYPVNAIVKDISWAAAQSFWQAVRRATGLGTIAPKGSSAHIRRLLGEGQIVAFLVDQHLPKHRAIVCSFCNQLAATTPAPVRFALETGAPILPVLVVRTGRWGHHRLIVEPEFELSRSAPTLAENIYNNTQALNQVVERWVRTYPEQWLWHHRRWKVQDAPEGWAISEPLQALLPANRRPPA